MRVYISCHHPDPANQMAAALAAAGHEVVSTWHTDPGRDPTRRPRKPPAEAAWWRDQAEVSDMELDGADALVLVASPEHVARTKCVPGGKFVEAGVAIGRELDVVTCDGIENGWLHHPAVMHAADAAGVVALLADE